MARAFGRDRHLGASGIAAGGEPGGEDDEQVGAVIDRFGS
jgi:hypothetical protein